MVATRAERNDIGGVYMPTVKGRYFTSCIRDTISAFYDVKNETFRDRPDTWRIGRYISKDAEEVLRMFTQLIVTTRFINDDNVKYFLIHRGENYEEAARKRNMSEAYLRKRVYYYCSASDKHPGKIAQKFGVDLFDEIRSSKQESIVKIRTAINNELVKYLGVTNLQNQIILEVPHYSDTVVLSDSEFDVLFNKLKPYIKRVMDETRSELTRRECSYFWHLMNNQYSLSDMDIPRYNRFCECCFDNEE